MAEIAVTGSNFIQNEINEDLKKGYYPEGVHTRFPPEPNGYLHVGHAKSICLNFGLAKKNNGICNLRFDDTNPVKEDVEYVDSIQEDIKWLGFSWDDRMFFASDYFGKLYDFAVELIKKGLAYVDDSSAEEIRSMRGTLTEPGQESPYRNRSVEENLQLFEKMKNGEFADGEKVLRAKIDMASPNIVMRDPVIYRIAHVAHHRTGNEWCIYPMYDFAHPLSDAIEEITHSICTLEFEDHRPFYDWLLQALGFEVGARPRQIEFARLNLTNTVTSKRKLRQLVEEGYVSGWDDPRMPTISGLRRRGYTPASLRAFCEEIGVAKANSLVDVAMLEHCVRDDLNKNADRIMAVLHPLKVVITNYPEGKKEYMVADNNPNTSAHRYVPFSRELYIEQEDFMEDAPKKFFRLKPEGEVRLKHGYIIKCEEVINWINSDFIGENVNQVIQLEDGRFILTESDYTSNTTTSNVWILNERDPKEFENVQLISLATLYMPSELNKAVNNFNRTHTDYRIGVMNYEQYNTDADYEAGLKQFENDMTSGIMADIICMSYMPYERYANKGLLMDFSDYISQLSPDEYFTNFFDSLRYGEKLYRIGFSYNVSTLEAKTDNVNGKNGLSLQEFSDLIANLPAGTEAFSEMTKDSALSELATTFLTNFIDVNTGACTFNSPEFVKLLELCNSYPSSEDDSRQDWEQEEWEKYWAEESYQYINDKTLFREATISDIKSYLQEKTQYFGDADVTLVGGPTNTEGSNGGKFMPDYTISASANSVFTNQIWEFCQQLLSEDAQESLSWSLPVSKKAFDKAASNALKPDTYIDEDGKEVEIPYTIWRGDEEVEVPLPTQADVDAIKTYIENIKETMYYNEQIYNIVYEEAQKYFSGDQTAQAAADMIQSRASIYLSEQT